MDVNRIAQVSTLLSSQQLAQQVDIATLKLANEQVALQGQAAVQLIESVPSPTGNAGQFINFKV